MSQITHVGRLLVLINHDMPFTDLISVSSLILDDVPEAASVMLAGHIRDPTQMAILPHAQRDIRVPWQTRIRRAEAKLASGMKSAGTIKLVAKYIPENRIVGLVSTYATSLADIDWEQPGSKEQLEDYSMFYAFDISEVNPHFVERFDYGYRKALQDWGIPGSFWQMAGICTLPGFEGKGVAFKLIDALFQRLAGIPRAPRHVFVQANAQSQRLYARYGFKVSSISETEIYPSAPSGPQTSATISARSPRQRSIKKHFNMTFDLRDVLVRASKRGHPILPHRSRSDTPETAPTLRQYNRILRPVQSGSDMRSQGTAWLKERPIKLEAQR